MLDFYLDTDSNDFVGRLTMQDAQWLVKMNVVEVEDLPFDDFTWTPAQVRYKYLQCQARAKELRQIPGFSSVALQTYEQILQAVLDKGCGLEAVSD